jgi:hypothetical protein
LKRKINDLNTAQTETQTPSIINHHRFIMYDSDQESPPPPLPPSPSPPEQQEQEQEQEWYNSRFGIGKGKAGKSKYPSKAKQNRMRKTRSIDKDDNYDGGLKNVEEGNHAMVTTAGNFRSSTISAIGMDGLFSNPRDVLDDINKTADEYDKYEAQAIIEEEVRQQRQLQQQRKNNSSSNRNNNSSSTRNNNNNSNDITPRQSEREKELKQLEDIILEYKHDHKEEEQELDEQRSRESRDQQQKQRGLKTALPLSKQSKSDDYDDGTEDNSTAVESKMMSRHTKKRLMEMKIYYTIGIIIFIIMCILFAYGGYIIYQNKHI